MKLSKGSPLLAIVAAVKEEITPLLRAVEQDKGMATLVPSDALGVTVVGRIHGRPVVVATVGDGRARAVQGLHALRRQLPFTELWVVGFAGALSPSLAAGTVCWANKVGAPRHGWLQPFWRESSTAQAATVWSVPRLVLSAQEKRSLYQATFESQGEVVVDLESHALGEQASAFGVPWRVLRVVSDGAEETLPAILASATRSDGSVDRRKVLLEVIHKPHRLSSLLKLRRKAQACAATLSEACCAMLQDHVLEQSGLDRKPSSRSNDHVRSQFASRGSNTKRRLEVL